MPKNKYYQGVYTPENPDKYEGNSSNIVFRSLWEKKLMQFADRNPGVKSWSSEEIVIPYISPVDKRMHRYFMDFKIVFTNGETYLVEVKPEAQTKPPNVKRRTKRVKEQIQTYAVNQAKWASAKTFAEDRNWKFEVWTERVLKDGLGLMINVPKKYSRKTSK